MLSKELILSFIMKVERRSSVRYTPSRSSRADTLPPADVGLFVVFRLSAHVMHALAPVIDACTFH